MTYINLGCGLRYHLDWVNIDFESNAPQVQAHNLLNGIPAQDASADVVYHSHVLEHFTKPDGKRFIQECHRVLKPGGVLRVAVPDLERIVREYLKNMELALAGSAQGEANYDWNMMEMLDQVARSISGGGMWAYLTRENFINREYVQRRSGGEFFGKKQRETSTPPRRHRSLRRLLVRWLAGPDARALQIGRFRLGGEVHQWMYDRYSLSRLLQECGFMDVMQRSATESYIPNWTGFNLDTEPDGTVYKPDSLFVEARKDS